MDIDTSYIESGARRLEEELHGDKVPLLSATDGSAFSRGLGPWAEDGSVPCSQFYGLCPDTDFLVRAAVAEHNGTPWVRNGYIGWYWWKRQRGAVPSFAEFVSGGIGVVR